MRRIELAPEVLDDLERIVEHLRAHEATAIEARIEALVEAIDILGHSPLIGRPVANGLRELVIGQGAHGYIALYRHVAGLDSVFVLAIRNQREAGYRRS